MSHVQASDYEGEHRLRDEPLPVRIPSGVLKYPREWCLNDGLPKHTEPIPYSDINLMRLYLDVFHFTYVAQGMLVYLIWKNLSTGGPESATDARFAFRSSSAPPSTALKRMQSSRRLRWV
jgi:hypothetical protein